MSMTLSTLCSKTPVKFHVQKPPLRIRTLNSFLWKSSFQNTNGSPLKTPLKTHDFPGVFKRNCGFDLNSRKRNLGFIVKAQNEDGSSNINSSNSRKAAGDEVDAARGESTMPERFRYLTKEAPDKPVRWPWFIALGFMLYAWRTVLWELYNWKRAATAIFQFLVFLLKLVFALILDFIGDPITTLIRGVETTLYTIRAFYSGIVAYAPIQELTTIIILASAVLAIAEATVPDSVNSQPYLLTIAGLIGFAAVRNYITELFFWILLLGMFAYGRLIKKRDYVSSALPVAAVLAAVGEPWVRFIVMASYLALAIFQYSKKSSDLKEDENAGVIKRTPVPLLCAGLAIGIRVAAKWAGYRHLTWMIV